MARQKSEDRVLPEGRRKPGVTVEVEPVRGGKAVPVVKQVWQLGLPFGIAEVGGVKASTSDGGAGADRSEPAPRAVPKPSGKEKRATSATMERSAWG